MKVYVAFRTDVEPTEKTAIGSMTLLRGVMKGTHFPSGKERKKPLDKIGAEYTVVLYEFKPSLGNVCQAIMDVTELSATSSISFRINEQAQLREVKE